MTAISLNPSLARTRDWYASMLEEEGRGEEALEQLTLAEGADPLSISTCRSLAQLLTWLGRFEDALTKIERLGELSPDGTSYPSLLGFYYLARLDKERGLQG